MVSTSARLRGYVPIESILAYIRARYDKTATLKVEYNDLGLKRGLNLSAEYGKNKEWTEARGHIFFKVGDDFKIMFYSYMNANFHENLDHYTELGVPEMVTSETTYIAMTDLPKNVDIVKDITTSYGGWFMASDSDEEVPQEIKGTRPIETVKRVTLADVYEKFGEPVIIEEVGYENYR